MDAVRGADLLLSAELVFAADSVAEMARIPWVVATLAPLSFMSRYDPPILIQAPWLGRIAAFSKPLYASLVALSQWGIRHWTEPVRQMRRDLGLTPGPGGLFGPRENAAALLAMFSSLVGRPQPDWPPNTRHTGFAFYDRHEPMPAALAAFLDAGDPPIVFTLGSAAVFDLASSIATAPRRHVPSDGGPCCWLAPSSPHCLRSMTWSLSPPMPRSRSCSREPRRSCTREDRHDRPDPARGPADGDRAFQPRSARQRRANGSTRNRSRDRQAPVCSSHRGTSTAARARRSSLRSTGSAGRGADSAGTATNAAESSNRC